MSMFLADRRVADDLKLTVGQTISKIYENTNLAELLSGYSGDIMFTTIRPNGDNLPAGKTGFASRAGLADTVFGPGYVYDQSYTGVPITTDILLVEPTIVQNGLNVNSFSGTAHMSLARVIFHELLHANLQWGVTTNGINFEEELVIFAENVIYRREAASLGETDTFIRYGHSNFAWDGRGVSGVGAFLEYMESSTGSVHIDKANTNGDIVTFIGTANNYTLQKVYHNAGYSVGEYAYDHYIVLTECQISGSYFGLNDTTYYKDARLDSVVHDLMHGDVDGGLGLAAGAVRFLSEVGSASTTIYSRVTGLGADAYGDGGYNGTTGFHNDPGAAVRYVGPANASMDTSTPNWLVFDDTAAAAATIVIGPGGTKGDIIKAGSGNDLVIAAGAVENFLYGNGENDILIGTDGIDHLDGGEGDDILIGRGGANELNGGSGNNTAYYGDRTPGIVVYDGLGRVEHDGIIDTFTSIQRFVGTEQRDIFVGDGQNHIFYGNGGSDLFLAADGADRFVGTGTYANRADEISFEALASGVDVNVITCTTTSGHDFGFVAKITGSSHKDIFRSSSDIVSNVEFDAGLGDDEIHVGNGVRAFGDDGNDQFIIESLSARSIDGGADYDRVDFTLEGYRSLLDLRAGTFTQLYGDGTQANTTMDIAGIEEVHMARGTNVVRGSDEGLHFYFAEGGVDLFYGGAGKDVIYANGYRTPNDGIHGGGGDDEIHGSGYDTLFGDRGHDEIWGGENADIIWGGDVEGDEIHGGDGNDVIHPGWGGGNTVWGDAGTQDILWYDFNYQNDPQNDDGRLLSIKQQGDAWVITTEQQGAVCVDTAYGCEYVIFNGQGWGLNPGFDWFI